MEGRSNSVHINYILVYISTRLAIGIDTHALYKLAMATDIAYIVHQNNLPI